MTRNASIAVAQTCPVAGDVPANTAEHVRLIAAAAELGAQIVVFPELSLTGYELELADALAFAEDDARLDALAHAAAAGPITVIAGAPLRAVDGLHIGAVILRPGQRAEWYTKHHLGAFPASANPGGRVPPPEASVFLPGQRDPLVDAGGLRAAVAVCADVARAAHAERAAERGARAYLASMFVIPADFAADSGRLQQYATGHGMLTALANYGAPSGGLPAAGRSSIWSADGELLVQLDAAGAGVAVVTETAGVRRATALRLRGADVLPTA